MSLSQFDDLTNRPEHQHSNLLNAVFPKCSTREENCQQHSSIFTFSLSPIIAKASRLDEAQTTPRQKTIQIGQEYRPSGSLEVNRGLTDTFGDKQQLFDSADQNPEPQTRQTNGFGSDVGRLRAQLHSSDEVKLSAIQYSESSPLHTAADLLTTLTSLAESNGDIRRSAGSQQCAPAFQKLQLSQGRTHVVTMSSVRTPVLPPDASQPAKSAKCIPINKFANPYLQPVPGYSPTRKATLSEYKTINIEERLVHHCLPQGQQPQMQPQSKPQVQLPDLNHLRQYLTACEEPCSASQGLLSEADSTLQTGKTSKSNIYTRMSKGLPAIQVPRSARAQQVLLHADPHKSDQIPIEDNIASSGFIDQRQVLPLHGHGSCTTVFRESPIKHTGLTPRTARMWRQYSSKASTKGGSNLNAIGCLQRTAGYSQPFVKQEGASIFKENAFRQCIPSDCQASIAPPKNFHSEEKLVMVKSSSGASMDGSWQGTLPAHFVCCAESAEKSQQAGRFSCQCPLQGATNSSHSEQTCKPRLVNLPEQIASHPEALLHTQDIISTTASQPQEPQPQSELTRSDYNRSALNEAIQIETRHHHSVPVPSLQMPRAVLAAEALAVRGATGMATKRIDCSKAVTAEYVGSADWCIKTCEASQKLSFQYESKPSMRPVSAQQRATKSALPSIAAPVRTSITGAQALQTYGTLLTPFEQSEILGVQDVWFVGRHIANKRKGDRASSDPNYGYDDSRGDYLTVLGDHINFRYEVLDVIGRGSFGQVLRCMDHATGHAVALKIIRNKRRFQKQAQIEADILRKLQEAGSSLTVIRRVAHQVLQCLHFLLGQSIVHCDLKPENILLIERGRTGIKVIDFGSSCYIHQRMYTYIQSRFYRSPEVILGLPYGPPIDMWSLGCILAELLTGQPIFPGEDEKEQLACIMEVLGPPPSSLLQGAPRAHLFFNSGAGVPLPCPPNSRGRTHHPGGSSLEASLRGCTDPTFVNFLHRCFEWDPNKRLTPSEALEHEWVLKGVGRLSVPSMSLPDAAADSFFRQSSTNCIASAIPIGKTLS